MKKNHLFFHLYLLDGYFLKNDLCVSLSSLLLISFQLYRSFVSRWHSTIKKVDLLLRQWWIITHGGAPQFEIWLNCTIFTQKICFCSFFVPLGEKMVPRKRGDLYSWVEMESKSISRFLKQLRTKECHYAPEPFKMWSWGLTFLKFDHITATQILREIEFWQIQTLLKCHFWHF